MKQRNKVGHRSNTRFRRHSLKVSPSLDSEFNSSLYKCGVTPVSRSLAFEVHQRITHFLQSSLNSPNQWENKFLRSLFSRTTFTQKQLNVLERIIGPLPYNSVEPRTPELPPHLEVNRKIIQCIHCGRDFELLPGKPGLIGECVRCLNSEVP